MINKVWSLYLKYKFLYIKYFVKGKLVFEAKFYENRKISEFIRILNFLEKLGISNCKNKIYL